MNEATQSISKSRKYIFISAAIFIILLVAFVVVFNYQKEFNYKNELISQVITNCEANGLKDAKITQITKCDGYYSIVIDSSNLSDFLGKELLNIDKAINVKNVSVFYYTSNGDIYDISSDMNKITKNGKEIYNDYYNSETHKSVEESKNNTQNGSTDYSTNNITENDKGFAWAVAEKEVKDRLKAPSTAKFPTYGSATISKSGDNFKVEGYVDAENSFGAEIRTTFTVEFTKNSEESYTVIIVTIDE